MSALAVARPDLATAPTTAVLRVVPAPRTEPPSEGTDWGESQSEADGDGSGSSAPRYVQGALAVDFRESGHDPFFGPQATPTQELPEPGTWARRMIQALLEAYEGTRSPDQLSRWVVAEVRERAHRRGLLARRRGRRSSRPPIVRSVHLGHPADGVCEVAAVVWVDGRVRALAMRMSGVDGRWLVTAWELG